MYLASESRKNGINQIFNINRKRHGSLPVNIDIFYDHCCDLYDSNCDKNDFVRLQGCSSYEDPLLSNVSTEEIEKV